MDADPSPVTTDVLADEHISLFLRHARRCAEDYGDRFGCGYCPPRYEHWGSYRPGSRCRRLPWSPLVPPPTGMLTLPTVHSLTMVTPIRSQPGATVMRSRRWHPTVPTLDRPHLIWLRLVAVTPRRRCLSTLARVVDDVSDGGFGTDDFADEVLSDDVA